MVERGAIGARQGPGGGARGGGLDEGPLLLALAFQRIEPVDRQLRGQLDGRAPQRRAGQVARARVGARDRVQRVGQALGLGRQLARHRLALAGQRLVGEIRRAAR